jgi:hypothetical protein
MVDDADYEWLSQWKWYALCPKRGGIYANSGPHGLMHRLIMSPPPGMEVDHVNGDGLDNRRGNLRICTKSGNQRNQRPQSRPQSSRFKGVHRNGRNWGAQIKVNGHKMHLGTTRIEEEAARLYDQAARQHFGEFARTNF